LVSKNLSNYQNGYNWLSSFRIKKLSWKRKREKRLRRGERRRRRGRGRRSR
jgi:hypothetical protein